MIRDLIGRDRRFSSVRGSSPRAEASSAPRKARGPLPAVETLEGRQLLSSFFTGATAVRPVQTRGGMYTVSMSGPGLVNVSRLGQGVVGLKLYGTTSATTVNIAMTRQKLHQSATGLTVGAITVVSGQLGSINAPGVSLVGTMTPLSGGANSLTFGSLGPNARVEVQGSLGSLGVGSMNLGPNGSVRIAGDLGQTLSVGGPMVLDGGQFVVGDSLSGALNLGSLEVKRGGQFVVGQDLSGGANITGNVTVDDNGIVAVGHDLGGLNVSRSLRLDDGGQFVVGNDLTGTVTIGQGLTLNNGGRFQVNRDVPGALTVTGNMTLGPQGTFSVGRDLTSLTVNGNLQVLPGGGPVSAGGNLNTLQINGMLIGQGSSTATDLAVGLDLGSITVTGAAPNQGSIQAANIDVGKSILGLDIRHGIFDSFITAGVSIIGGTPPNGGGNIGPDGPDAILNSEIRAGVNIDQLTINGHVRSTFPTNPGSTGYPTRILAGVDRKGVYSNGGLIDHFVITGSLIDSTVAASVSPSGGDGTLPSYGYNSPPPTCTPDPNAVNTYDAPAGTTTGGTVIAPVVYNNWTELSYYNQTLTGVHWNTTVDPVIDDCILFGAINPSFASQPLSATELADPNAVLPLPTQSTVLGGVISTNHGNEADFAGLLAADTRGVFIGRLPDSSGG
ncbi:MAG: hypothetical protein U0794_17270 [Isosphaeraceae bacterium]